MKVEFSYSLTCLDGLVSNYPFGRENWGTRTFQPHIYSFSLLRNETFYRSPNLNDLYEIVQIAILKYWKYALGTNIARSEMGLHFSQNTIH